jgi:dTMP kinase
MKQGKFITLEGGEGVGKSTNLAFIEHYLQEQGVPVVVTREPGGTQLAEEIRSLLLKKHDEKLTDIAELLLVFAARSQHIERFVRPQLEQGVWVVSDRFTDASFAYQGGGRNMEMGVIRWLEQTVQKGLQPDMTLLLDAPVDMGMQRAKQRAELDRFETEQMDFFERVRAAYLARANDFPDRFQVIDAAQSLLQVQTAIEQVLAKLCQLS